MDFNLKEISYLAKSYNPLDYSGQLVERLSRVYPDTNLLSLTKFDLHCLLNETLITRYKGEHVYKYELFRRFFKRRVVAAFEIKINKSRLDFLTIGQYSTAFEIKSEFDNLSKLTKQMADYLLAFEFNYLVVDKCHVSKALDILPHSFGLWYFDDGKYFKYRVASKNDSIDPEYQLKLLTKKELIKGFRSAEGDVERILNEFSKEVINKSFKEILSERYRERWTFITAHKGSILPVDVQFFFNTNIQPQYVYH
ncbi:sce7726 family protein [Dyadobacter jiangsuensis]|uniref:Uncharacterized protein n=1 Tax=Dyadobacter jiangsuensis TaxID=1591085 RepID=A0A2P8FVG7_9BACT|nr:sce7726 family protein [Dyadobacter jiangsuensis]PSL25707.1 hypothetical protein CLV60_111158 [Dyadobacter jiangsuensis]